MSIDRARADRGPGRLRRRQLLRGHRPRAGRQQHGRGAAPCGWLHGHRRQRGGLLRRCPRTSQHRHRPQPVPGQPAGGGELRRPPVHHRGHGRHRQGDRLRRRRPGDLDRHRQRDALAGARLHRAGRPRPGPGDRRPGERQQRRPGAADGDLYAHRQRGGPHRDPRHPGRQPCLAAQRPGGRRGLRDRHGPHHQRLLVPGPEPRRRPGHLRGTVRVQLLGPHRRGGRRRGGRRPRVRVPAGRRRRRHQPHHHRDHRAVGHRAVVRQPAARADRGGDRRARAARGGVVVRPGDFNPERVLLDDSLAPTPTVDVGDSFPGAVVGVLDYSFGNFKLEVTATPTVTRGGLTREVTAPTAANQLALATFNVENLDPGDPQTKFDQLAGLIVDNLRAPDLVAVEEIQDDNGPTDNGVVTADTTFAELIAAVQAAGGPTYDFCQIDPVNDQDGGEPGGNIRVGFLFRTDRGLQFIDRPGGTSTAATTVVGAGADTRLSFSPGRIDPANSAFNASRKPLAGEFTYNGHHLFVIANHFNSKGGDDDPLFGHSQPPTLVSEAQRKAQATVVHDFVTSLETADPDAAVVVLGDLNDFEFSPPLATLEAGVLHDLIETLPQAERYTYDFEGNSQALDHILLSDSLFAEPFDYDAVHVNSEFATQASDHDPQVVRITLGPLFNFSGFLQPVDNLPVRNTMRAGLAVPVNFSLDGYKGLGIMASGYPKSQPIACDTSAPTDAVETTLPALLSVLLYDPRTDTYVYVWKTDRSWANTCRQLIVKLDDGSVHRANFQFTRR